MKNIISYKLFESNNFQDIIELVKDELLYLEESLDYIVMVDKVKYTGPASSIGVEYGYDFTSKHDFIQFSIRPQFSRETLIMPIEHHDIINIYIKRAMKVLKDNGFRYLYSDNNEYGYLLLFSIKKHKHQPQRNTSSDIIKENYTNSDIKIDDIYSESDIYIYIQKIHRNEEDFYEGNISNRIEEYSTYKVMEIAVDDINMEWEIDWNYVRDYVNLYKKKGTYPPPVLGWCDPHWGYTIIDGIHRIAALKKLGFKNIICFVGQE